MQGNTVTQNTENGNIYTMTGNGCDMVIDHTMFFIHGGEDCVGVVSYDGMVSIYTVDHHMVTGDKIQPAHKLVMTVVNPSRQNQVTLRSIAADLEDGFSLCVQENTVVCLNNAGFGEIKGDAYSHRFGVVTRWDDEGEVVDGGHTTNVVFSKNMRPLEDLDVDYTQWVAFDPEREVLAYCDRNGNTEFYAHTKFFGFSKETMRVLLVTDDAAVDRFSLSWISKDEYFATSADFDLRLNTSISLVAVLVEDKYGNTLDHNGDVVPYFAKWTILHKNSLVPPTHRKPIKYRRGCDFRRVQPTPYRVMRK